MKKIGRNEMKQVKGGMLPLRTLWRCACPYCPPGYIDLCSTSNPEDGCGDMVYNCQPISTCSSRFNECI